MGHLKSLDRSVDTKGRDAEIALKLAWVQKGCASLNIRRIISTAAKDCIKLGIPRTINRGIRPLLEPPTAKADHVSSGPTPTSNRMETAQAPDIELADEQVSSIGQGGECKPPRNFHKRPEAHSF